MSETNEDTAKAGRLVPDGARLAGVAPNGKLVPLVWPERSRHVESLCGVVSYAAPVLVVPPADPTPETLAACRDVVRRLKSWGYDNAKMGGG